MSVHVRYATLNDLDAIVSNVLNGAMDASGLKLDEKLVFNGVKSLFDRPSLGQYIVSEINQNNVGSLVVLNEWSDWNCGIRWWIHSVYVREEQRQKGIYRSMYDFVKLEAQKSTEVIGLNLSVDKNNHRARNAYERLGMRETNQALYNAGDL